MSYNISFTSIKLGAGLKRLVSFLAELLDGLLKALLNMKQKAGDLIELI